MAGYIGSKASVVSSGAERKKVFTITTTTTSLTGLAYTPTKVHVFHNGIRLVDGTDYTATNGTSITLTNAAESGDEVVVVSYATFQTSDTVSASAGGTFAGDVSVTGSFTSRGIDDNATSTAMTLDGSGNVGIGVDTPSTELHIKNTSGDADVQIESTSSGGDARLNLYANSAGFSQIRFGDEADTNAGLLTYNHSNDSMAFKANSVEVMRITAEGDLLVGKDTDDVGDKGFSFDKSLGRIHSKSATDSIAMDLRRSGSDGIIAAFRSGNTTVFKIEVDDADGCIDGAVNHAGIKLGATSLVPRRNGVDANNSIDLGNTTYKFDDIYATNGNIQTSDANEKQDVADLTATEMLVAARISSLFKTFRWIDSVSDKGDNARTHTGVIAQDVRAAFAAEGLDAGDYALFTSATWWEHVVEVDAVEADEEEGIRQRDAGVRIDVYETEAEAPQGSVEVTRMGIRYTELLAFVSAYNDQRFAFIETRLAALEGN